MLAKEPNVHHKKEGKIDNAAAKKQRGGIILFEILAEFSGRLILAFPQESPPAVRTIQKRHF